MHLMAIAQVCLASGLRHARTFKLEAGILPALVRYCLMYDVKLPAERDNRQRRQSGISIQRKPHVGFETLARERSRQALSPHTWYSTPRLSSAPRSSRHGELQKPRSLRQAGAATRVSMPCPSFLTEQLPRNLI